MEIHLGLIYYIFVFHFVQKHRSSSKFSLHGWIGGSSGKQTSRDVQNQPSSNAKSRYTDGKRGDQPLKAKRESVVHGLNNVSNDTSVPNQDPVGVLFLDKCVVSQECADSPVLGSVNAAEYHCNIEDDQSLPQKNNSDVLPKIKWGDLDDGALILPCGNTAGAEIRFGGIAFANMVCRKVENTDDSVSCTSTCTAPKENKLVVTSIDVDDTVQEAASSSQNNVFLEENCKEVNALSPEDVKEEVTIEKMACPSGDVSSLKVCIKDIKTEPLCSTIPGENVICSAIEDNGMMVELSAPAVIFEADDSISDIPRIDEGLSTVVVSQGLDLVSHEESGSGTLEESVAAASVEDLVRQKAESILDGLSKGQIISAISAGGAGESKERFRQRLWCFLFENLNRAVDELYLLCELECDLEQMKEAVLVLDEAASDFKELNNRVEAFEKVKRSSSQLSDEAPITLKSDHRRPHALSWEVRRMTTSPHRAEILSSSLEAFRKIQQERAGTYAASDAVKYRSDCPSHHSRTSDISEKHTSRSVVRSEAKESVVKSRKQVGALDSAQGNLSREKRNVDSGRSSKVNSVQNGRLPLQSQSTSDSNAFRLTSKESSAVSVSRKSKTELLGSTSDAEKGLHMEDKTFGESISVRDPKSVDSLKRHIPLYESDKDKRNGPTGAWKSMDAWKEKRNWEHILASSSRVSSRYSHSPGMSRKSTERARILRDKLMSPEKKKKTSLDLKKEADEKHARALRIRSELENERVQKLHRTSEKLNRVNEWQAVRSMKLREGMHARHQRSETRHEAFLAQVVRRAGDESSKVNEVRFITSLNEENKKLMFRQKHHDSELRRAEKLLIMKTKQKEDMAREEAVLERKKLIEAEKLQRLVETQRKKEEAQVRREEERKASSAAREAKTMEQMRRKEVRAKAQQEEAELLAQKLAERLSESEQRRKFYLEQIRERASMDFRDQSSPLQRRFLNKEGQGKSSPTNSGEDEQANNAPTSEGSTLPTGHVGSQNLLKRRIKKIRQRLMALKYEFSEISVGVENAGIGYRAAVGTARARIGRWLQELQRCRQARKEGAACIGLITAEMIKFLEGKDPELHASRQAGLIDFIASALPASHASKPEACQVTIYLLRLLRVVLSVPANTSYFLAQNLLPPLVPMLAAALENYIKIAASATVPSSTYLLSSKTSTANLDSVAEVLDGFLWTVAAIIGHASSDERQLQMQDGLVELVIAYQVIHRLRDLFALYDRPQVEGSPFPSSILLSINLLATLTFRFKSMFSIDWESFPIKIVPGLEFQAAKVVEVADCGGSILHNSKGEKEPPIPAVTDMVSIPLPDVPEDRPLDESCQAEKIDGSLPVSQNADKADFIGEKMDTADVLDESQSILKDDIAKSSNSKKDEKSSNGTSAERKNENRLELKQPVAFLISAISETGLVCLPSMLTAVLLQANNRLSSEQVSYNLPSNFEEVATGVLKVLNNLAMIDVNFIQRMLARADLKMEFFHLMSFLLSYCTSKWGVATDQIGFLLLESLLLLGYFSLLHHENQAVLRWGKSPTILHKVGVLLPNFLSFFLLPARRIIVNLIIEMEQQVCDLPFVFFSDPELMPVLAATLVAACFECEQNKGVVQQELSLDMLLSLLKSCRNGLPGFHSRLTLENNSADESTESNQLVQEYRKLHGDIPQRVNRHNLRSSRPSGRVSAPGNSRTVKTRNQKESKAMRPCDEMALKHNLTASETSFSLMLHSRFPESFLDKAEHFFSADHQ
ncbi:hypothetical protein RJ640_003301 [Escallonia rubra]|uniref:S phase cyclin A-associated protein in the endoplasmic reticulum N-terminal domain-containing protein n=1 Tax=Escallonia rubra TaxID=112253 RepID=A0AA88U372_9ASTE|nr:hypothetical protein RJ640_003301 [Escallonia rubra]